MLGMDRIDFYGIIIWKRGENYRKRNIVLWISTPGLYLFKPFNGGCWFGSQRIPWLGRNTCSGSRCKVSEGTFRKETLAHPSSRSWNTLATISDLWFLFASSDRCQSKMKSALQCCIFCLLFAEASSFSSKCNSVSSFPLSMSAGLKMNGTFSKNPPWYGNQRATGTAASPPTNGSARSAAPVFFIRIKTFWECNLISTVSNGNVAESPPPLLLVCLSCPALHRPLSVYTSRIILSQICSRNSHRVQCDFLSQFIGAGFPLSCNWG